MSSSSPPPQTRRRHMIQKRAPPEPRVRLHLPLSQSREDTDKNTDNTLSGILTRPGASDSGRGADSGSRSAPSARMRAEKAQVALGLRARRPKCAVCGHCRHVHPLAWWRARGTWIWHCCFIIQSPPPSPRRNPESSSSSSSEDDASEGEKRERSRGHGGTIMCMHMFIAEQPRPYCRAPGCHTPLHLEQHGGVWGYDCRGCDAFLPG